MAHFLITLDRGPEWDARRGRRSQDGWDGHAAFMDELVRRGVVLLGGPLGDDVDAGPALVVVAAPDAAAAVNALVDDPWHDSVLVTKSVDRWTLWLGVRSGGLLRPPQ
ncbi:hypothetical protein SPF06_19135 [Sinomonas sp. JGH33]|uniref:YCII-related domain-containing protein n=1 Tax=Sinomonas terricola TaxID=3110330 RepID=A0ABU5TAW6_9MICC|nr:hypothetical protein [Sinomonas sp. JGH33]MEA5456841.1 hypothetical protein [Sinomonas sp. JGH33]